MPFPLSSSILGKSKCTYLYIYIFTLCLLHYLPSPEFHLQLPSFKDGASTTATSNFHLLWRTISWSLVAMPGKKHEGWSSNATTQKPTIICPFFWGRFYTSHPPKAEISLPTKILYSVGIWVSLLYFFQVSLLRCAFLKPGVSSLCRYEGTSNAPAPNGPCGNVASKKEVQMCWMLLSSNIRISKSPTTSRHLSHFSVLNPKKRPWLNLIRPLIFSQASLPGANPWFALVSLTAKFFRRWKLGTLDARRQSSRCTRATRAAGWT